MSIDVQTRDGIADVIIDFPPVNALPAQGWYDLAAAVTTAGAGVWSSRLLPLPAFLVDSNTAAPLDWRDGLRLTGHFLERDAFGHQHRPLPAARQMLYDRVAALAAESEQRDAG